MNGAFYPFALILGDEHPRHGDVLELTQVAEVVMGGQAPLTRPAQGFTQPTLRNPHPCLQRRYRTHIWVEVTHIQALCLVEQVESTVQISPGLPYSSHSNAPAIRVLRDPGVLSLLLASQQMLRGSFQIVPLTVELAHPRVHVRRYPNCSPSLYRRKLQGVLVGTHRLVETSLRNPNSCQGECAPDW